MHALLIFSLNQLFKAKSFEKLSCLAVHCFIWRNYIDQLDQAAAGRFEHGVKLRAAHTFPLKRLVWLNLQRVFAFLRYELLLRLSCSLSDIGLLLDPHLLMKVIFKRIARRSLYFGWLGQRLLSCFGLK